LPCRRLSGSDGIQQLHENLQSGFVHFQSRSGTAVKKIKQLQPSLRERQRARIVQSAESTKEVDFKEVAVDVW
jgi:hypothetical protein